MRGTAISAVENRHDFASCQVHGNCNAFLAAPQLNVRLAAFAMDLNIKDFESPGLLIAAAETEDEVGTVLRIHLIVEQVLVWYIGQRRTAEIVPYVKVPREFGGKLSLSAAFGLPLPLVRVIHQINVIRNKLAHGRANLGADQVQELARQVEKLVELDQSFSPLKNRYIELPVKRPGERIVFGSGETRLDFLIAATAFYSTAIMWVAAQSGDKKV